ncbi:MAG: hypothetical protein Q9216_003111, partial [Gyalolechia sp. 2 TL-2023]
MDYVHRNAQRISSHSRRALRFPAERLTAGLAQSVHDLEQKRGDTLKVKGESE